MERKSKALTSVFGIVLLGTVLWLYKSSTKSHLDGEHSVVEYPEATRQVIEDSLTKYAILNRKVAPKVNHSNKTCDVIPKETLTFHSQSNEDKAIFETFYINKDGPTLCHGTFVEIGALDGLTYSNSLFFENALNWSGVLIEGNPALTDSLNINRPNSRNFGGLCPCKEGQKEVLFVMNRNQAVGGVLDDMSVHHFQGWFKEESNFVNVPCKPMGAILHEAGIQSVDIFFIDVEGSEHVVLKTMDWTIPVRIIMVEMGHSNAKDKFIRSYLEEKGFLNTLPEWNIMSYCVYGGDCARNEVFINPDFPALPSKRT